MEEPGTRARAATFAVRGPIARTDLPGLCVRICALLEQSDMSTLICDVTGVPADASRELLALVDLMGLRDVLPER